MSEDALQPVGRARRRLMPRSRRRGETSGGTASLQQARSETDLGVTPKQFLTRAFPSSELAATERRMIERLEVDRIVDRAATAALRGIRLAKVYSEPMIDSEGQEALRVTIVVEADERKEVTGDKALNAIVRIHRDLQQSGDERFPIVDFVHESELDLNGST